MQVRSRFAQGEGKTEDFGPFLSALEGLGFANKSVDSSNSHFVIFEMQKCSDNRGMQKWPTLNPCSYKRR